jgi:hypothetical protein
MVYGWIEGVIFASLCCICGLKNSIVFVCAKTRVPPKLKPGNTARAISELLA